MHNSFRFTAIATHHETDSDELTGAWELVVFGKQFLPDKFSVEFFDAGTKTPDGKPAEDWMRKGYCPIGIWGSPFDEHRSGSRPRKVGECAATLMAKFLGVAEDPKLKPILNYILRCDYGKQPFRPDGLSVLVKTLHWQHPTEPTLVMSWFFKALDAKYGDDADPDNFSLNHIRSRMLSLGYEGVSEWYELAEIAMEAQRLHFNTITPVEYAKGNVYEAQGPHGAVKVAVVESDEKLLAGYSRTVAGGQCAVLIQKKSTGHVQIFSNKRQGIFLGNVAKNIRLLEMAARGKHNDNPSSLFWEGSIYGAECWCLAHDIFLLNGSNTTRNVKPTKLTLEQILDAVYKGLAEKTEKQAKKMAA